ncbi:MAG TPA: thiamine ABC transporter substrate-binding protein [Candidatus Caenarcaniphilales bacterium]|nr:thiamine ABC transporter substrate-binding protein [Candidatus Caenarcaniphilales bacterium]
MDERFRIRHWHAVVLAAVLVAATACTGGNAPPTGGRPTATGPAVGGTPASATSPSATTTAAVAGELRLMTHSSFAISDEVMREFERVHDVRVRVLDSGDAGSMVNQAILARGAPLADVLFGVDNTFLSRALEADLFVPYRSELLEHVPSELQLDQEERVTPIDYGDVCLNYDRAAFDAQLPPPQGLEDLVDERYRGMLVVENPATSSPGLAFLLATIAHFGEDGARTWLDYWADLRANDVLVTADWNDAYYGRFSGGAGEGERPIVVSYASSPAAEVVFSEPQPAEAPTAVVEEGCFRQVEFAGILRGARDEGIAQEFIDFMLSERFQADIPLNMFVFPANAEVELPDVFARHAAAIDNPTELDPFDIGAERERWIEEWTDVVLR